MSDTVKMHYSAFSNISYHGEWDTCIDRQDWNEMSDTEKQEVIIQLVFEDIDVSEVEA